MNEIWKDIKDYEGLYQVSSLGKVKSLPKTINGRSYEERILKPKDNGTGYLQIKLCKNNKTIRKYLHRIVAMTFLTDYKDSLEVNHINHNKYDNSISNLEMVTHFANVKKAIKHYGGIKNGNGFYNVDIENLKEENSYCIECGKKISKKAKRCKECSHKWQSEELSKEHNRPTKEKLEREIKKYKNLSYIAKLYNVSRTSVTRWCKKYNIEY